MASIYNRILEEDLSSDDGDDEAQFSPPAVEEPKKLPAERATKAPSKFRDFVATSHKEILSIQNGKL